MHSTVSTISSHTLYVSSSPLLQYSPREGVLGDARTHHQTQHLPCQQRAILPVEQVDQHIADLLNGGQISLQHDERQIGVPNARPYVSYSNTIGTLHLLDEGNGPNILPNLLSAFFPVDLNNERRVRVPEHRFTRWALK